LKEQQNLIHHRLWSGHFIWLRHGARFCGHTNHEEESNKLEPLIKRVAQQRILVMALDLNGGATFSFNVCKAIHDAAGGRKYTIESCAERKIRSSICHFSETENECSKCRSRKADDSFDEAPPPTSAGSGFGL
jgi:hypothetical protein